MQDPFNAGSYTNAKGNSLTCRYDGENGWFPSHPDCPNHKGGAPVSLSFSKPTPDGQVSCAGCFLHSTILQSMGMSCPHLHACSDCAICYSHSSSQSGASPPLFSSQTPPQTGISPPLLHQDPSGAEYVYQRQALFHSDPDDPPGFQRTVANEEQRVEYHAPQPELPFTHSQLQIPSHASSTYSHANSPQQPFRRELHLPKTTSPSSDIRISPVPHNTSTKNLVKPSKHENRKRGANDVCDVCGDRASGYHYNALTCEGCKGFFRRSIQRKDPLFRCKYGGNCEMDTYTRRKCPECRLKKCKAVGMLEECLLTEIQCQSKRNRKQRMKKLHSSDPSTPKPYSFTSSDREDSNVSVTQKQFSPEQTNIIEISDEDKKLVDFITSTFTEYATNPGLEKKWSYYFNNPSTTVPTDLSELATFHVKLLVEFTKKLPGFTRMKAENQIGLLKGSVVEMMLLRNACSYNRRKREVDLSLLVKDTEIHEDQFRSLLDFFEKAGKLDMDNAEYGLLCSIILFDGDHANTDDKGRIDRYRDMYLKAMRVYSEGRKPKRTQVVAKILNLVTELRTLYSTHSIMVSNFRKKGKLTPLLCEVWDLK